MARNRNVGVQVEFWKEWGHGEFGMERQRCGSAMEDGGEVRGVGGGEHAIFFEKESACGTPFYSIF